jgi:peptidoglycan/LPS O-acetylase OafA/YrhL
MLTEKVVIQITHDSRLTGHLPPLDGVRGLAILLVMVFHVAHEVTGPLSLATGFGWAGVDLFFALSGFLITGILLDARGRPDYYRRFYVRRARRIFPLYYVYCAGLILVTPIAAGTTWQEILRAAPWYLTYMVNVRVALNDGWVGAVLPVTVFVWSLCVEEQFYAVWPAVVARIQGITLVRICVLLAALAFVARLWAVSNGGSAIGAYVLLPMRMDGLALGAAAAVIARRPGGLDQLARWAPAAVLVSVLGFAVASGTSVPRSTGFYSWRVATLGASCTALGSVALVVLALAHRAGWWSRLCCWTPLRFAGRRAYGLYMLSGLALVIAESMPIPGLAHAVLACVLAFVFAEVSWWLVERPRDTRRAPRLEIAAAEPIARGLPIGAGPAWGVWVEMLRDTSVGRRAVVTPRLAVRTWDAPRAPAEQLAAPPTREVGHSSPAP